LSSNNVNKTVNCKRNIFLVVQGFVTMKKTILYAGVYLFLFQTMFFQNLTKYVDPFIGTGGHGHTFPGATLPFGMVQLSPDTGTLDWDWCSGFHESDSSVIGFSQTHLSGTGCADYGDILIVPTTGKLKFTPGSKNNPDEGYRSRFKKANEKASPGYYSVIMDDYNIFAELTATLRAGFHRYTFPETGQANILIDLEHGISDRTTEAFIKIEGNSVQGFRRSYGWAADQIVYFYAEFSKEFSSYGIYRKGEPVSELSEADGTDLKSYLTFSTSENEQILVKVGISAVSLEGAKKNLLTEIPGWDFDLVRKNAESAWEKELGKIIVETKTDSLKTIFYTSLYHTLIHPNIFTDVDGKYRGSDKIIYESDGSDYYTVFSLWDTYRALHPLFTIIEPEKNLNFIRTLIKKYRETGILPVWELASNETGTMIGYHSIPVIADAFMKGYRDFDFAAAFEAMKHSAEMDHLGLKSYKKLGYVARDLEHEAVSKSLEYAYDDWCIAMMAKELGKDKEYNRYSKRALNYVNLFDGSSGFMRGKDSDGNWLPSFNPFEVSKDYTEANAWQYAFYVPHDLKGMSGLHGGKERLIGLLDEMFTSESTLDGKMLSDITGLVGQYAQGNEPSHHMAYLYSYLGEPAKTQKWVRYILDNMFTTQRDGIPGNEDCGQMSAWYVFSSMGFYPVTPGSSEYILGTSIFDRVTINLPEGKQFVVEANNPSADNYYVSDYLLNGKKLDRAFINHSDIVSGAELSFIMSSEPRRFDISKHPVSLSETEIVSPPYIPDYKEDFEVSREVKLETRTKNARIYYRDPSNSSGEMMLYSSPFTIEKSGNVSAVAVKNGDNKSVPGQYKFFLLEYLDGAELDAPENGVNFAYYEGDFRSVENIKKAVTKTTGILSGISLKPASIEHAFGFIYDFYFYAENDGIYRFYTLSDDGSALFLGDRMIVDNDGPHSANEESGVVALKKGYHRMTLLYFEGYVDNVLKFSFEGPDQVKREMEPKYLFLAKKE